MNVYPENTMAAFHNLLAHPVHLGDWHVVLAEIMFPTSVENFRANEYFQYTQCTNENFFKPDSDGVQVSRESSEDNAEFPLVNKKVKAILKVMEEGTRSNKPFESCSINDQGQVSLV